MFQGEKEVGNEIGKEGLASVFKKDKEIKKKIKKEKWLYCEPNWNI